MKLLVKLLMWPLSLAISALVWASAVILSRAAFLFGLASALTSTLALAVLLSGSMKNALILLGIAFLVSPLGLPMLAAKLLGGLASVNGIIRQYIHN